MPGVGRRQKWRVDGAAVDRGCRGMGVGRGRLRARSSPDQSAGTSARLARIAAHTAFFASRTRRNNDMRTHKTRQAAN